MMIGTDAWGIDAATHIFDAYRDGIRELEAEEESALEHFDSTTDSTIASLKDKREAGRKELEHVLLIKRSARQSALRAITCELLVDIQKAMIAYRTLHGLSIADLPKEVIEKPF